MALAYRCDDTAVADYCQTSSSLKRPLDQPVNPFGYVSDTAGRPERKYRAAILFGISDVSSHNGTTQRRRTMIAAFGRPPKQQIYITRG